MLSLIVAWLVNTVSLLALAWLIPAVQVRSFGTALAAALVLSLLNVLIRPVLFILTLPVTVITLGLFIFVINGFLFWLATHFLDGFAVRSFWWAVFAAFVYSLISWAISSLLPTIRA